MFHQRATCSAIAGNNVDNTSRKISLLADFGEKKSSQRSCFSWLQYNGITGSKRRGNFPSQHQEWEVPRNDLSYNAMRFGIGAEASKFQFICPTCVIEEMSGRKRNIHIAGLTNWLAIIHRLNDCELACAFLDQPCNSKEVLSALFSAHL